MLDTPKSASLEFVAFPYFMGQYRKDSSGVTYSHHCAKTECTVYYLHKNNNYLTRHDYKQKKRQGAIYILLQKLQE